MSDKARVSDNLHYVKDMNNFAILNTNKASVAKHQQKIAELRRAKMVEEEINNEIHRRVKWLRIVDLIKELVT